MSRQQVRDILGTPLVSSVFHADRWDYVFTIKRQGVEPQARRLTVFFKGDVLERSRATRCPAKPSSWRRWTTSARRQVPVLEASEESLKQFSASRPPAAACEAGTRLIPARHQLSAAGSTGPIDRVSGMTDNAQSLHKVAVAAPGGRMGHMLIEAIS
jgi:outer membrane protein assembly factor BamE